MNLILKTRTANHVEVFWNKTQDAEIKRLFPSHIGSLEEALILYQKSLEKDASSYGKVVYFEGNYIGDIWCYCIDEMNEKMAMLSVVIFEKELWGKGIATSATKMFVEEVFKHYDITKIGAFTYSNNYASIGVLKKAGFVKIEEFIEDDTESIYFELNLLAKDISS